MMHIRLAWSRIHFLTSIFDEALKKSRHLRTNLRAMCEKLFSNILRQFFHSTSMHSGKLRIQLRFDEKFEQ